MKTQIDIHEAARRRPLGDLAEYLEASLQHLEAWEQWRQTDEQSATQTWDQLQITAREHRESLDRLTRR